MSVATWELSRGWKECEPSSFATRDYRTLQLYKTNTADSSNEASLGLSCRVDASGMVLPRGSLRVFPIPLFQRIPPCSYQGSHEVLLLTGQEVNRETYFPAH